MRERLTGCLVCNDLFVHGIWAGLYTIGRLIKCPELMDSLKTRRLSFITGMGRSPLYAALH